MPPVRQPSYKELVQRLTTLEQREIGLNDLPLRELQNQLEQEWQPDGGVLLLDHSVTKQKLADGVPILDGDNDFSGDNTFSGATTFDGAATFNDTLTVAGAFIIPYVTSLPASPVDGQEVYYAASLSGGNMWHLRYRAGSGSIYKWEFVGGSPLTAENSGSVTPNNTSYVTATSPSVTVPLAGEYIIEHGAQGTNNGTTNANPDLIFSTIKIGAAAAADAEAIEFGDHPWTAASNSVTSAGSKAMRRTVSSANSALTQYVKTINGLYGWGDRWLKVTPVRVG